MGEGERRERERERERECVRGCSGNSSLIDLRGAESRDGQRELGKPDGTRELNHVATANFKSFEPLESH